MSFGDTCSGKVEGDPLCLDVDGEDKIVYDMYIS